MVVMVLLRIIADGALFMMVAGPAAVHFGARPVQMIITFLVICAAHTASFLVRRKCERSGKPESTFMARLLRLLPYAAPFLCILIPGRCLSWAIVSGLFLIYAAFLAATDVYLSDADHQKSVFRVTAIVCAATLLVLLLLRSREVSFTMTILSCFVSLGMSALLLRSLRHDPEVYNSPSFQLINTGIMAVFAGAVIGLSQPSVLRTFFGWIRTGYQFIAQGFLYVFMFIIEGVQKFILWFKNLIGFEPHAIPPQPVQNITMESSNMFDDIGEVEGLPKGIVIGLIVFALALVVAILIIIFRALAGRKGDAADDGNEKDRSFRSGADGGRQKNRPAPSQVKGVRRQYRKYLNFLKSQGVKITEHQTSEDIEDSVPEELKNENAGQLRSLYLRARYNGEVDENAEQRAKELVHKIKAGRAG